MVEDEGLLVFIMTDVVVECNQPSSTTDDEKCVILLVKLCCVSAVTVSRSDLGAAEASQSVSSEARHSKSLQSVKFQISQQVSGE